MKEGVNDQLNIPDRILVGFQEREYNTFTGKLGYVTYFKGTKIAKEKSWENWRDKNITPLELENLPVEGLELNKETVGGTGSGWNQRQEYVRVYDPRGFEFEITVSNLLFILQETGYTPEEGLRGKFIYAWDGVDLALIPTTSEDYIASVALKEAIKKTNIGARDLVVGKAYKMKNWPEVYYLGKQNWRMMNCGSRDEYKITPYHTFLTRHEYYSPNINDYIEGDYVIGTNSMSNILLELPLPKKSIIDVENAVGRFKEKIAGNTSEPTELRIVDPSDKYIKKYNRVLNKTFTKGSWDENDAWGARIISDTKIEIYKLWLEEEIKYTNGQQVSTGKIILGCRLNNTLVINNGKFENVYPATTHSPYSSKTIDTDPETLKDLVPVEYEHWEMRAEVKIGDFWYLCDGFLSTYRPEVGLDENDD